MRNLIAATAVAHIAAGRYEEAVKRLNGLVEYDPDPMMLLDFCHGVAGLAHGQIARKFGSPLCEMRWDPTPEQIGAQRQANMRFGMLFVSAHTHGDLRRAAELFRAEMDMHDLAQTFHGGPPEDGIMASVTGVVVTAGGIVRAMR